VNAARYDVIVAGAGMVGACAALALAARGMRVALIEAAPAPAPVDSTQDYDLRVSAISPRSRQILRQLGIWQQLDATRICNYEQMHVWHQHGDASLSFDAVDLARADLGAIVENRMLQQTLQHACDAAAHIEWFRPDRIEALIENNREGVQLRLDSGRYLDGALLVAADGRNSPTREMAGIEIQAGSYRQSAIVANVSTELPHRHTAWQRFLASGPLAFLPLANGQSSIVWSCDDELAERLAALDDLGFREALGDAFEHRLGTVTACSERRSFALGWHDCERWLQGRVLLIGDAAHAVHPLAGQGVNQGFSDVELCAQLIGDCRGQIRQQPLRRFERQRKSETWLAGNSFSALKWIYGLEQGGVTQLRDLGMRIVDSTPWLKRSLIGKAVNNIT
jgi:ubiquinone biosynthesis UbiH/UbiF/VisC/COQ6 family hydroxylase